MPTAILLYLGQATRMLPLSLAVPKSLISFCNRPLLEYTLEELQRSGILNVVLVTSPQDVTSDLYSDWGRERGMDIVCAKYGLELGSAGVVEQLVNGGQVDLLAGDEDFFVIFADSLFKADLRAMLTSHRANVDRGGLLTVGYHRPEDLLLPARGDNCAYGVLTLDDHNRVTQFREKPPVKSISDPYASAALFVFNRRVFDHFQPHRPLDLSRDVMTALAPSSSSPLIGFDIEPGFRFDIGTLDNYMRLTSDVINGRVPLAGVPQPFDEGRPLHRGRIEGRSLVGSDSVISADATLRGTNVIGNRVRLGAGCEIRDSIIMDDTRIAENITVSQTILGRSCRIGPGPGTLVDTVLGDWSVLRFP